MKGGREGTYQAISGLTGESESTYHTITHPFESTRFSRFYPAGALRNTELLLTPAGDVQDILSLSSGREPQVTEENQRLREAQQDTYTMTRCLRTRCWIHESAVIVVRLLF